MKALHVIPAVSARYGGPSVAVFRICRALSTHRVDTTVVTTDADGPERLGVPLGRPVHYCDVRTLFFPRRFPGTFKYSGLMRQWLRRAISDYDIVHIHAVFNHSSLVAARAARQAGVPYLVRPLGTLSPWSLEQSRWKKKLLWHLAVERKIRRAAALHFTSVMEKDETAALLGSLPSITIPLGVDERFFAPSPPRARARELLPTLGQRPYVLFLSRIHPKKRVLELVEAFHAAVALEDSHDWCLVIAGRGEPSYESKVRRRAQENGLHDRVFFPGWAEGETKRAFLVGASVFVLPSKHENFGLAAAEAMVCGVPIVVSDRVGLAPDVREARAGWVVDLTIHSLREILQTAMRSSDERQRRGRAGRRHAMARFDWPRIGGKLAGVYQKMIASAGDQGR